MQKKNTMFTSFTNVKKPHIFLTNVIVSKLKEEMKRKLGEIYKYFSLLSI